jgi:hypothetical protein
VETKYVDKIDLNEMNMKQMQADEMKTTTRSGSGCRIDGCGYSESCGMILAIGA